MSKFLLLILVLFIACNSQEKVKNDESKLTGVKKTEPENKYAEYQKYIRDVSLKLEAKKDTIIQDVIGNKINFEGRDFKINYLSKKDINFSDLKGKVVLVDYWATWCGPCKMISPFIAEIKEKFKGKDLVVLGLSNEDELTIRSFAEKNGEHYDFAFGDSDFGQMYGVQAFPSFYLFDKNGKLQYAHKGAQAYIPKVIEWQIEHLLN